MQVTDTGGGIPPEDIPRVFTRLYRADNVLIQGVGDTGVGLSIAKTLTKAQNGRIWVESEAGVGSTFSVLLPILEWEVGMDTFRQIGSSLLLALFSIALVIGGSPWRWPRAISRYIPTATQTLALNPVIDTSTPTLQVLETFTPTTTPSPTPDCPATDQLSAPGRVGRGCRAARGHPGVAGNPLPEHPGAVTAGQLSVFERAAGRLDRLCSTRPDPDQHPLRPARHWNAYIVRPGDTLTGLAQAFRVSLTQLQVAGLHGGQPVHADQRASPMGAKRGHPDAARHCHRQPDPGLDRFPRP